MIRFTWAALFSIVLCGITITPVQADPIYSLIFGASTYYVAPGATVEIEVYLVGPESPVNDGANGGLLWVDSTITPDVTSLTSPYIVTSSLVVADGFDPDGSYADPDGASVNAFVIGDTLPYPQIVGGQVLLYTLSVQAPLGAVEGSTTLFTASVKTEDEGGADINYNGSPNALSAVATLVDGTTTIEIETIPEPATVTLAIGGLLLISRRRRVCP